MVKQQPRGIRNNNPLNIRIGNVWLGEVDHPTDPAFEQFISMKYGLRAAFVILRRYIKRYRKDTIAAIVSTWAPSSENDTIRYIDFVCSKTGLAPDVPIKYQDEEKMVQLVAAMAQMECGKPIDEKVIREGYHMA